jgi:UDP-2,4-diacetamido-2,4,6-trideoxy-beta-L-altropyranose hydrolase
VPRPQVLFRADGDTRTGLGHVVRSLALVRALEGAFEPIFATRCEILSIQRAIEAVARRVTVPRALAVADEPGWIAEQFPASALVVLDGYQFQRATEVALRASGRRVVSIDDVHERPFAADLIINHAGGLSPSDYRAEPQTRFALGPAYALIRPAFLAAARARLPRSGPGDVLVCLGGADPNNEVLSVTARALRLFPAAQVEVVLGAAYAFRAAFDGFAAQQGGRLAVHANLGADQMVAAMRRCGTAILPPSGVSYEYASIGGLLLLHPIADNQRRIHQFMVDEEVGFAFADGLPNAAAVARMEDRQRALFDGRSDERLLAAVQALMATG